MKKLFEKIGYGGLSQAFYKFFYTHIGYMVFTSLHSTFMNTLLMRVTGESDSAMLFNLISGMMIGLMQAASVPLAKRTSVVFPLQLGVVVYLLMYGFFFAFFDSVDKVVPLLAVLSGVGAGAYWFSYNMAVGGYLVDAERDRGLGFLSAGECVAGLTVPFFAGWVISSFEGLLGYVAVFALGLAVAALTVFLSMRLVKFPVGDSRTYYGKALRITFTDKGMFTLMLSNLVKGIRMGTLLFFLNILVYDAAESEFVVGLSNLLSGTMGILGGMAYGRLVKENSRFKSMIVATTVLAAGALALLIDGTVPVIAFSMLNSFFVYFLINPNGSIFFAAIDLPEHADCRGEFNGIRETSLSIGRTMGVAFTMVFSDIISPAIAILLLTLSQYLMIVLQIPIQKVLDQHHSERK
ncbi:MAG: hypothetical protein IJD13_08475 [Oscillospiraceae bacterium]|nr:hypothetical protein [Oscillospiraceae bacterium]